MAVRAGSNPSLEASPSARGSSSSLFILPGSQVVKAAQPSTASAYVVEAQGKPQSLEYRLFFYDSAGNKVSPWHDIPLHAGNGLLNFIVEIPKETNAKMEVATKELYTPIKQDIKKGTLCFYPYNINWNYGLFPQTWEDPSHSNAQVEGAFGDNDLVDVVEIGERSAKTGEVLKVKPLAVLALIDEGELDWKIIAISADDPKASLVNDVQDVERHFPTISHLTDYNNIMGFYKGGTTYQARFKDLGLTDQPHLARFVVPPLQKLLMLNIVNPGKKKGEGPLSHKGTLMAIRDWFRDYKTPDGKSANKFGLDNKVAGKDYALKVIAETNKFWENLIKRSTPARGLSLL